MITIRKKKHVVVGMSGGVDSSVAAYLLTQQSYHVTGLFMKNWEEDDTEEYCSAAADLKDASQVCDTMGIQLQEVNFAHEYWENVFSHFLNEYQQGRTPNPDILCNKEIKFKEFLLQAEALGADYIATGHYVAKSTENNSHKLLRGIDNNKDQSYFLYTLQQDALKKSLFPLGDMEKTKVRNIANDMGFITHDKKDSTGICFIGERKFKQFLSQYLKPNPGAMIDPQGNTVGQHDGLMYYTIGQRQGLNIGGAGPAWFVAQKDINNNRLTVVQGHDHPLLYKKTLHFNQEHWVNNVRPKIGDTLTAKIRYRQKDEECRITAIQSDTLQVEFTQKQRAITPGQAIVFYQGRVCLGGGTICS